MEDPPRIDGVISAKEISSKDAAEFAKKFLMEFGNFLQEDIDDDIEELSTDPALTRQEREMGPQSQVHDCLVDFVEYHLGVGNAGVKRYYDLNPQKATTAAAQGSAVKTEAGDDAVAIDIDTSENILSPKEIRKVEKTKEKELKRQEKERKKELKRQEKEKKKELKKERKEKRRRSKGGDGEGEAAAKKIKSES